MSLTSKGGADKEMYMKKQETKNKEDEKEEEVVNN
jgi:hypothetical protein